MSLAIELVAYSKLDSEDFIWWGKKIVVFFQAAWGGLAEISEELSEATLVSSLDML